MVEGGNAPGADWPSGRVGFVAIVGRPNVGKSTFLNTVLDFRLAAVSPVPQTTRRRCLGIRSEAGAQMLFLDTPGVHQPEDPLGEAMLKAVNRAVAEADLVLCFADPTRPPGAEDALAAAAAKAAAKPVIVALNKSDLAEPANQETMRQFYLQHLPAGTGFFNVCAKNAATLDGLLAAIRGLLPKGPFLYPPEELTDMRQRQVAAEMLREAVCEHLRAEVPHAIAVDIESWDEAAKVCRIGAVVYVDREQHKAIVLGRNGSMLRRLCHAAEEKLAGLCEGRKAKVRLWVKLAKDWRRKPGFLREHGMQ